ncbi:hypothetical protein [Ferruginibacter profundus]
MKNKVTPLVDEYLESIEGLQQTGTGDFFYTRLKARMNTRLPTPNWGLPFKPALVICTLCLLLIVNGFMLSRQFSNQKINAAEKSSLQKFAESYDLVVSPSY